MLTALSGLTGLSGMTATAAAPVAASEGPRSPVTLAGDNSTGTVAWTNPGNAAASDDSYAEASGSNNAITHFLKATNFGFSVPAGATITGIKAEVEMGTDADFGSVRVNRVSLVKGGAVGAQDRKADANTFVPGADTYRVYGSNSQLWGEAWTPADINAAGFGVAVSFALDVNSDGFLWGVRVDHFRITVYYTT